MNYLTVNNIYLGDSKALLKEIEPDSVALSFWSPPYHVGKEYEENQSYEEWARLLEEVIALHFFNHEARWFHGDKRRRYISVPR